MYTGNHLWRGGWISQVVEQWPHKTETSEFKPMLGTPEFLR